ncbi:contractile injection system tape measure protein [Mucilaginibacter sp. SP1R1]|uniref:contractile injection system tape measure protein n=1 Tax=Mucilaginibacter sp. SP1R1 TaxID=2723091 RepID=UPI0016085AA1|nr:contractile injection system tape measure protein [Mucilaginibacter sp. SP1R1]MBB6151386.1 hypothetical protein [Mucilaginibacter sp. SP1R1]
MSRHIIHRQQIILNVPNREGAYAFQNRVSALLQHELPGNMEAVFDELFPSDDIIRIDSLQLNLGNVSPHNFEKEFKTQLIEELRKSLSSKKDKLNDENNEEILSSEQSVIKTFIYFLENGHLPWYGIVKQITEWEDEISKGLSGRYKQNFSKWLIDNYQRKPVVLQRLVHQFTDKFLENILLTLASGTTDAWKLIYDDLTTVINQSAKGKSPDRVVAWKCIFHTVLNSAALSGSSNLSESESDELVLNILKSLANDCKISAKDITPFIKDKIDKQLKTTSVKNALLWLKSFPENETIVDTESDKNKKGNDRPAEAYSKSRKQPAFAENESIYIKNSGIVILHYFLNPFFSGLNLLKEGKFVDDTAHHRAVLLLHYLATGNTQVAEFELTLYKILCGYRLEETLPATIILSKVEKNESEKLLKAVIDHWKALKNTSVEGLRNTFFDRDGKLTVKENGWLLTVEQKTVDILLGKLPWGFSTVRLPWMQQILNVDWY